LNKKKEIERLPEPKKLIVPAGGGFMLPSFAPTVATKNEPPKDTVPKLFGFAPKQTEESVKPIEQISAATPFPFPFKSQEIKETKSTEASKNFI